MNFRAALLLLAVSTFVLSASAADKPKAAPVPAPATPAPGAATTNEVVARVNGTEIKRKELDAAVQAYSMQLARRGQMIPTAQQAALQHDVLEELVGRELVRQEGNQQVAPDLDKRVQEQLASVKKQFGGDELFEKALGESGITAGEYANRVRDNLIIRDTLDALIAKQVKITPEETKAYYEKNPEQFKQPESVRASHILIRLPAGATDEVKKEKRAQIDAARALVKGGEKFADIAKKVSEDPGSAANGGDLGYFRRGAMVPEFDTAAFSSKTNELSEVITTQFGYHVLLVTDHKPAQIVPFEQVKDDLAAFLKDRKGGEVAHDHVAELRKAAKVEVLLPAPPPPPAVETAPVRAPSK